MNDDDDNNTVIRELTRVVYQFSLLFPTKWKFRATAMIRFVTFPLFEILRL